MSAESISTSAQPLDPSAAPPPECMTEQSAVPRSPTPPADPPEYNPDAPVDLAMSPVDFDIAHAGDHHVVKELHEVFKDSPTFLTEIPTTQYLALLLLSRGDSISKIARVHQMSRTTIHRWLRHDARFIAAVNQGRHIHRTEMNLRLSALAEEAVDTMVEAVRERNLQASMFVIRHVDKDRPGSLSPKVIAKRIARRKQRIADFMNSPEGVPNPARITSTVGKPPALLEGADPSSSHELSRRDNVGAAEQKGETPPPAAQAPGSESATAA